MNSLNVSKLSNSLLSSKLHDIAGYLVLSDPVKQLIKEAADRLMYDPVKVVTDGTGETQLIMDLAMLAGKSAEAIVKEISDFLYRASSSGMWPAGLATSGEVFQQISDVFRDNNIADRLKGNGALLYVGRGPRGPQCVSSNWCIVLYRQPEGRHANGPLECVFTHIPPKDSVHVFDLNYVERDTVAQHCDDLATSFIFTFSEGRWPLGIALPDVILKQVSALFERINIVQHLKRYKGTLYLGHGMERPYPPGVTADKSDWMLLLTLKDPTEQSASILPFLAYLQPDKG